jgi:hypothetical protein
LRGVTEDAVCTAEGYVYVTIRMSEAHMRRADALDAANPLARMAVANVNQ